MNLTSENFILYAAHYYDVKKSSSQEEFLNDLKKIVFIKKLFKRYETSNDLQTRLILNHLVVFYNCFGSAATPMLYMKLDEYHHYLKPFVEFLGYGLSKIYYDDVIINNDEIIVDKFIQTELDKI